MSSIQEYCDKVAGKPAAVVGAVLRQALSSPSVYFYSSLYHMKEVQALAEDAAYASLISALKLIMYGTYGDLDKADSATKELFTTNLTNKLRQLTVLSLAAASRRLHYKDIQAAVGIADVREMEDLIIDSITEGLLAGLLDQRQGVVEVHESVARDVNDDQIDGMISVVEAWISRCDAVTAELKASQKLTEEQLEGEDKKREGFAEKEEKVLEIAKKNELENKEVMEAMDGGDMGGGRGGPRGGKRPMPPGMGGGPMGRF